MKGQYKIIMVLIDTLKTLNLEYTSLGWPEHIIRDKFASYVILVAYLYVQVCKFGVESLLHAS